MSDDELDAYEIFACGSCDCCETFHLVTRKLCFSHFSSKMNSFCFTKTENSFTLIRSDGLLIPQSFDIYPFGDFWYVPVSVHVRERNLKLSCIVTPRIIE